MRIASGEVSQELCKDLTIILPVLVLFVDTWNLFTKDSSSDYFSVVSNSGEASQKRQINRLSTRTRRQSGIVLPIVDHLGSSRYWSRRP